MPGGPTSSTPAGMRAPRAVNFSGYLRNSTTSCSSVLASSTPATSLKVTTVLLPTNMRARLRPKLMAWLLLPCAWRNMNQRNTPMSRIGKSIERSSPKKALPSSACSPLNSTVAACRAGVAGGLDVRLYRGREGSRDRRIRARRGSPVSGSSSTVVITSASPRVRTEATSPFSTIVRNESADPLYGIGSGSARR